MSIRERQVVSRAARVLLRVLPRTRFDVRRTAVLGALGLGLVAVEPLLPSPYAPRIHVRWNQEISSDERQRLESAFRLARPEHLDGATWRYDLADTSPENIAALIAHPAIVDTHAIDRTLGVVEPGAPRGTTWLRSRALHFWRVEPVLLALATTSAAATLLPVAWLVLTRRGRSRRACLLTSAALLAAGAAWQAISSIPGPTLVALVSGTSAGLLGLAGLFDAVLRFRRWRALAVPFVGVVGATAITFMGGTTFVLAAAACGVVYLLGYVAGALIVPPSDDDTTFALGIVRTLTGLLLSTLGFFLCLRLSLPWGLGPAVVLLIAAIVYRRAAFTPPRFAATLGWGAVITGLAVLIAVAPFVIAAVRMAPGQFPPVFYGSDTAYFLDHVHSLVKTTTFPPPSLSFVGGVRAYHYGSHGLVALVARSSGLAPHHTLFLVVLPLLTAGVVAAAVVLARRIGPLLPPLVSVPLLLTPAPTLWYGYWDMVGPRVTAAAAEMTLDPLQGLLREWATWGVSSEAHNMAARFLVLACLAGVAAARARGWRLPVFLAGVAFIVKAPTGVTLVAGLALMQAVRAATERSLRPLIPALAAVAILGAVYSFFWVVPGPSTGSGLRPYLLYQISILSSRGGLAFAGFGADVVWLVLPALIAVTVSRSIPDGRSLPLLLFVVTPFFMVNALHASGGVGFPPHDDDWLQFMHAVPLLLRAFVVSVLGQRWTRLGSVARTAVLSAVALAVVPPLVAAAFYTTVLIRDPRNGDEFADNRALGEALAIIPTEQTILVTNDLHYAARIPALFGHQTFAGNFQYEWYLFSEERLALGELLRATAWNDTLEDAARTFRWTHFVVRKDDSHPAVVPLERLFENDAYVVFRFRADAGEPRAQTMPAIASP